jgi:hypothetical protein
MRIPSAARCPREDKRGIEFDRQTQEVLYVRAAEVGKRQIEFLQDQRDETLDRFAAPRRELQIHFAPIAIAPYALQQSALRQLIDDARECAAVVTKLETDVLGVQRDAIP